MPVSLRQPVAESQRSAVFDPPLPLTVKTEPEEGKAVIRDMTQKLYMIARLLQPIMPATSDALKLAILANKKPANLFPRKE